MKSLGIKEDNMTIATAMCVSLVQSALNNNIKAFQVIRDQIQENPQKDGIVEPLQNIIFLNDIGEKLKEKKEIDTKELKE